MKFNLLSDLHLERKNRYYNYLFPCTADNLILAGDIGNVLDAGFEHFLRTAAKLYVIVVFIIGNHEPYGTSYQRAIEISRDIASRVDNLYFLEKDVLELEDTVILGTTLHSYVPLEARVRVASYLADFRYIQDWRVTHHNDEFEASKQWISDTLHSYENGDKKFLVLTHHAPTMIGSSDPKYTGKLSNHGFATELTTEQFWNKATGWIFGHTHYNPTSKVIDGVKIYTNMEGYEYENVAGFDANTVFSV